MSNEVKIMFILGMIAIMNIVSIYKHNDVCDRLDIIEQSISASKTGSK